MGRHRDETGEDGMTIRVLTLCGKELPPLGFKDGKNGELSVIHNMDYQEMYKWKVANNDDRTEYDTENARDKL